MSQPFTKTEYNIILWRKVHQSYGYTFIAIMGMFHAIKNFAKRGHARMDEKNSWIKLSPMRTCNKNFQVYTMQYARAIH